MNYLVLGRALINLSALDRFPLTCYPLVSCFVFLCFVLLYLLTIITCIGGCYLYEVSVRHDEARGAGPEYKTSEVLCLLYHATPLRSGSASSNTTNAAKITVIAQLADTVNDKTPIFGGTRSTLPLVQDLIRELKKGRDLKDLLANTTDSSTTAEENTGDSGEKGPSLEDFDLMAVLGRGGFGKVMQVRHKGTGLIYAMKILKKSELRRRRQVSFSLSILLTISLVLYLFACLLCL